MLKALGSTLRASVGARLLAISIVSSSCASDPAHEQQEAEPVEAADGSSRVEPPDARISPTRDASARAPDARAVSRGDASSGPEREVEAVEDGGARDARMPVVVSDAMTTSEPPTADSGASEAVSSENSAAGCALPKLAAAGELSPQAKHPDPFKMLNGTRITKRDDWRCRRAEIRAQLEEYESGPKPSVMAEQLSAKWAGNTLTITVSNGAKTINFAVNIARPANAGSEPIPLLIAFTFMTLDSAVFAQNGVATTIFEHDALGAQMGGGSRGRGLFYDLYGSDHPASSMVAWAWGASRILDALARTPEAKIDPARVAVTGCSRYGKGALLAGALDDRIALTIPQESGAGGSASWRVSEAQSAMGVNVQTLANAANEQPWFRASFGRTFGGSNVARLPFDHHMVMGLVAPRPLLVIDNPVDWLGIDSSFTAGSLAHTIWKALGADDRMGYSQSSAHTHCQFPAQQRAILDAYVKKFLLGADGGDTRVLRAETAKAELASWMDWTTPSLQ
jgi:hypothetical protein